MPGTTWCQTVLVLWSIDKIIWQSPPRHYIYRVKYKPAARPYSPRPLIMGIIKTKTHQSILLLLDLTNCSIIDLFLTSFDWIEPEKTKNSFPLSFDYKYLIILVHTTNHHDMKLFRSPEADPEVLNIIVFRRLRPTQHTLHLFLVCCIYSAAHAANTISTIIRSIQTLVLLHKYNRHHKLSANVTLFAK